MTTIPHRLYTAITRDCQRFFTYWFLAMGVVWALLEPLLGLVQPDFKGWDKYGAFVLMGLVVALIKAYPKSKITFKIHNTNVWVEVLFGNLFDYEGFKVIPVSRFFWEGPLHELISKNSIQGYLMKEVFGNNTMHYQQLINEQLDGRSDFATEYRGRGPERKFPVGTTLPIQMGQKRFLLLALTHSELTEFKTSKNASLNDLWMAYQQLWATCRTTTHGEEITIPLLGSGISGIGLPHRVLLDIALIAVLNSSIEGQFAQKVRIVLHPSRRPDIRLEAVQERWA